MANTIEEYEAVTKVCRELFLKKTRDYGTAWRILRPPSVTDQIFIKAQRIRTLEEKLVSKVDDDIVGEYIGIINYCIMGIIQIEIRPDAPMELSVDEVSGLYELKLTECQELMIAKNHDYGEAWRDMRISSLTDLILMKLLRVKQIEDNKGVTVVSEGIKANYQDMLNYSVFALIKMSPQTA